MKPISWFFELQKLEGARQGVGVNMIAVPNRHAMTAK